FVIDSVAQLPGMAGICGVIKGHRLGADVLQFDELVAEIDADATERDVRRMIIDFADYNWSYQRAGVLAAKGVSDLKDEILRARAQDITAKGYTGGRSAEIESVSVASQCLAIAGEKINLVACGIEAEAVRAVNSKRIRAIEDEKPSGGNDT